MYVPTTIRAIGAHAIQGARETRPATAAIERAGTLGTRGRETRASGVRHASNAAASARRVDVERVDVRPARAPRPAGVTFAPPGDGVDGDRGNAVLEREHQSVQPGRHDDIHPGDQRTPPAPAERRPVAFSSRRVSIGTTATSRSPSDARRTALSDILVPAVGVLGLAVYEHQADDRHARTVRQERDVRPGTGRAVPLEQRSNGFHSSSGCSIVRSTPTSRQPANRGRNSVSGQPLPNGPQTKTTCVVPRRLHRRASRRRP